MTEYLTVKEVAQHLKLSPLTVHRHLNAGIIKGQKYGQKWRIRREDLDHPRPAELTAEEQLSVWREVEAEVSARYPLEQHDPPSDYHAAQDALWRELGYDGYTLENWLQHRGEHGYKRHLLLLEQAEASLAAKDRTALAKGRRVELENAKLKEQHRLKSWQAAKEALARRGLELVYDPDAELPAFVTAVKTGQELLRRTKK